MTTTSISPKHENIGRNFYKIICDIDLGKKKQKNLKRNLRNFDSTILTSKNLIYIHRLFQSQIATTVQIKKESQTFPNSDIVNTRNIRNVKT